MTNWSKQNVAAVITLIVFCAIPLQTSAESVCPEQTEAMQSSVQNAIIVDVDSFDAEIQDVVKSSHVAASAFHLHPVLIGGLKGMRYEEPDSSGCKTVTITLHDRTGHLYASFRMMTDPSSYVRSVRAFTKEIRKQAPHMFSYGKACTFGTGSGAMSVECPWW